MSEESNKPGNQAELASAFAAEEPALRRLLWGLLREASAVDDALQSTFLKFLQHRPENLGSVNSRPPNGGTELVNGAVNAGSKQKPPLRAWLFRVATNEALLLKRKFNNETRHLEGLACLRGMTANDQTATTDFPSDPRQAAIALEQRLLVRKMLTKLPTEQQAIVKMRIYENLKFVEIAEKLNLPLGTVLTRMRAALHLLKTGLENLE